MDIVRTPKRSEQIQIFGVANTCFKLGVTVTRIVQARLREREGNSKRLLTLITVCGKNGEVVGTLHNMRKTLLDLSKDRYPETEVDAFLCQLDAFREEMKQLFLDNPEVLLSAINDLWDGEEQSPHLASDLDADVKKWDINLMEVNRRIAQSAENVVQAAQNRRQMANSRLSRAEGDIIEVNKKHCVNAVAASPVENDLRFATCGKNGHLAVWNIQTGELIKSFPGKKVSECLHSVAWSADGKILAAASGSLKGRATVHLWNHEGGHHRNLDFDADKQPDVNCCVVWSPDGYDLCTAAGKTVRLWALKEDCSFQYPARFPATQPQAPKLPLPSNPNADFGMVYSVVWSAMTHQMIPMVVATTGGGNIVLWNVDNWHSEARKDRLEQTRLIAQRKTGVTIKCIAVWQGTRIPLLALGHRREAVVWAGPEMEGLQKAQPLESGILNYDHDSILSAIAWSHDGYLATVSRYDNAVTIWRERKQCWVWKVSHKNDSKTKLNLASVAWSQDGNFVLAATTTGMVHIARPPFRNTHQVPVRLFLFVKHPCTCLPQQAVACYVM